MSDLNNPFDGVVDGVYGGNGIGDWDWALIGMGVLVVLVLIVIWRFSNFRKDRVCVSTNLGEYWPSGYYTFVPPLPGQKYLPRLSQFLPAGATSESVVAARYPWMVNDRTLSAVAAGN